MDLIILLLINLLQLYVWVIILTVMVSWLAVLGVLNMKNRWARRGAELLDALTRPPILFLRRFVPPVGGIDLTPMIVVVIIYVRIGLLQGLLYRG